MTEPREKNGGMAMFHSMRRTKQELPQEGEAVDMQEADEIEGPVEPDQPAPFEENSDVTGTED